MIWIRFVAVAGFSYQAGADALRAAVSIGVVWMVLELAVLSQRVVDRRRRSWRHEPRMVRPFDWRRDK